MSRNAILDAAALCIERGWHVLILTPTKRPVANCRACRDAGPAHDPAACGHPYCHGLYSASLDLDRVADQLDATPDGMLAVRTGAVSGVIIVDIDPAHGGRIEPDRMPRTHSVRTGGAGWHLYYRHPGTPVPNSQGTVAVGVDIRGDGGYAVLPPSIHPRTGRRYVWGPPSPIVELSPALLGALRPAPIAATATRTTTMAGGRSAIGHVSNPDRLLDALVDAVLRAPEGRRRTTLYGAARRVATMVAAGEPINADRAIRALTDAGHAAGQTDRETRTAILGGFRAEGVAA